MNKIGILTWHYYPNFGSALQAYALQSVIKGLGYKVSIINYRNPKFGNLSQFKQLYRYICAYIYDFCGFAGRYSNACLLFVSKYLNQTKQVVSIEQVQEMASGFDAIVYGSDQIWAPNVFNPIYMGENIPPSVRKVSYAASVGLDSIPFELVERYRILLSAFHAVSVRESEGRSLLEQTCGISSKVVLDPTLLLHADVYRKLKREVNGIAEPYVFCYFLNRDHEYTDCVRNYVKEKGLKVVGFSARSSDADWMQLFPQIGPCEFLWLIDNADVIVTDSYHGGIFSMLFHKNIHILERFSNDDPICQNSRIRQLDKYFDISNLITSSNCPIQDVGFDYAVFESRLSLLRKESYSYLEKSLG